MVDAGHQHVVHSSSKTAFPSLTRIIILMSRQSIYLQAMHSKFKLKSILY